MAWPPSVDDLKIDLGSEYNAEDRDDERLQLDLDAAVAFTERYHGGRYNFEGDVLSELPEPDDSLVLGTLRLAGRWYTRRRSPEGLMEMAEMGQARVPSIDPDIARMLRIGRHEPPEVA